MPEVMPDKKAPARIPGLVSLWRLQNVRLCLDVDTASFVGSPFGLTCRFVTFTLAPGFLGRGFLGLGDCPTGFLFLDLLRLGIFLWGYRRWGSSCSALSNIHLGSFSATGALCV
jgi:hypothetical protein